MSCGRKGEWLKDKDEVRAKDLKEEVKDEGQNDKGGRLKHKKVFNLLVVYRFSMLGCSAL